MQIWRKTDFLFQKWQEFGEFWSEHSKVSIIYTLIGPFRAKYIKFDLKSKEELSVMTLKSHAKFEEKVTCALENDMMNLANFHQNIWKCQNRDFAGILLSKIENTWTKKLQMSMYTDNEEWWEFIKGIYLSFQNWHKEFDKFWLKHWKVSKIRTLIGWFWPKYIMF